MSTVLSLLPLHAGAPVVDPAAADGTFTLLWLVIALPALGAAILLLGGRRTDSWGHWLGLAMSTASFVISVVLFVALLGRPEDDRQVSQHLWNWFTAGSYEVNLTLLMDQLSALFMLLITGVGSLIHLYSVGYMAHDERRRRFFAYLNLFVAAMLTLVMSGDYLGLFLGWEGVGLASYLLIGFWQHKPSAAAAAKKAFVVNRVGDIGLSLGSALMFVTFGSTAFTVVSAKAGEASQGALTGIGLLLLLAACGKSAQFPLHTWLLDAMEGPTPVSALIHAATMVTAGVYLIVRSSYIFTLTADARLAVVIVGTITMLMGAIIGTAKDDIKKALAGSTMSQIGYMILAAGLGPVGYAFAILHLITHGFFKANLFLGAGSVMHGMNDEVDMRRYGALAKAMPITYATFGIAYLAIIGVPPFAGFWSKDKIIESALAEQPVIGALAILGAGITAFYMTRMMLMTFWGKKRWADDAHPHESPSVMTIPLVVLGVLSAAGGALLVGGWFVDWLAPVVGTHEEHHLSYSPWVVSVVVLAVVAIGIALAWQLVGRRPVPTTAPANVSVFTRVARAELYGDAMNDELFTKPGAALIRGIQAVDDGVVDGTVRATASSFWALSGWWRLAQNGYVRSYALALLGGATLILLTILAVNAA